MGMEEEDKLSQGTKAYARSSSGKVGAKWPLVPGKSTEGSLLLLHVCLWGTRKEGLGLGPPKSRVCIFPYYEYFTLFARLVLMQSKSKRLPREHLLEGISSQTPGPMKISLSSEFKPIL